MAEVSYIYTKLHNDGDEAKTIEFLKYNLRLGGKYRSNILHVSKESPVKKIIAEIVEEIMSRVYNSLGVNIINGENMSTDEGTYLIALVLPEDEVKIFKHKYNIVVTQETSEIE